MLTRDADPLTSSVTGDAGTNVRWLVGDTSLPAHIDPELRAVVERDHLAPSGEGATLDDHARVACCVRWSE